MSLSIWKTCLIQLKKKMSPTEFSMWIYPLKATFKKKILNLYAPNNFVLEWVKNRYIKIFKKILYKIYTKKKPKIILQIFNKPLNTQNKENEIIIKKKKIINKREKIRRGKISGLNKKYNFNNFVEGKSNQLAKYSSYYLANNLNTSYNPLFLYSNTGLGKTHLLHAIGNCILKKTMQAKVIYIHSEKFVQNMVRSLKNNSIEKFKKYYRSVDALLIDDIQFFSNKERSQEELFHTFNTLFEGNQKIILTSDRYPREINGITERLKSRFEWGITVSITPPELETRISILLQKALDKNIELPIDVAHFIAQKLHSNVRELEGALNKIKINSLFEKTNITLKFVQKTLKNLTNIKNREITIEKIQKTVAEYYNLKTSDILLRKRSRSIVEPRQVAMALTKKLTQYSLPEIGFFFGKKNHTTVLHACQKIKNLKNKKNRIFKDFTYLLNQLTS